ncbi:GNAT family N-acetyltransferase [Allokutzneria oryzae]|uniref:GNAT family N-acetyltransferase n=1 Tax=Allokutzneria oryzae TaxID=1378989 RepID=A0ABV5ZVW9_9PSEU
MTTPVVRRRTPEDLPACVKTMADVHAEDGYPSNWPTDPERWLTPDELLGCWVSVEDGEVLGHVALQRFPDSARAHVAVPDELAAITRLFVSPRARRRGVAKALVDTAVAAAGELRVALDVADIGQDAIAFYERTGWRRVASARMDWTLPDGERALVHYYLRPREST